MRVVLFLKLSLLIAPVCAQEVNATFTRLQASQILVGSADSPDRPYLAFPAVLDLGQEVLVSFKHGRSHGGDVDASLDWVRLHKATGAKLSQGTLARVSGEIMQMGEWVRFSNGEIANFIDAQDGARPPLRTGLRVVKSRDAGLSFGPVERLGTVDGVEYGYAFDSITGGETTWLLVMTFINLSGGEPVYPASSRPGSVDVIRSDDNGRTWRFVRSITRELGGAPINESAFVRQGDGFLVTCRGYDGRHWLLRTTSDFQLVAKTDLNDRYDFIMSHIGRPRLFQKDGAFYLLGRNHVAGGFTQLALFTIAPDSLAITRHLILDPADGRFSGDSYYAQPYWHTRGDQSLMQVITYKRGTGTGPDIIRLEYDWNPLRQ